MKKRLRLGLGGAVMLFAMMIGNGVFCGAIYFFAALWHECGHILAARRMGIGIREVRFDFSGARLILEERMLSYGQEIRLALCGPLFNLVGVSVACAMLPLFRGSFSEIWGRGEPLFSGEIDLRGALIFFALSSLAQAVTNLLPVSSFDGGRVLYCLLARWVGEGIASRVLSITSLFSVFLLWSMALYLMLRISAGLGVYVFAVCIFFSTAHDSDLL